MQAVGTVSSLNSLQTSYRSNAPKAKASQDSTSYEPSAASDSYVKGNASTPASASEVKQTSAKTDKSSFIEGFNLDEFNLKIRAELLDQIKASKDALKNSGLDIKWASDILYAVDESVEAAEVPDEWNADNTSQRIVDFALQFREAANAQGISDEDFMAQIKDAVSKGFRLAKGDIGDLPQASAKLFNDTYKATMDKLDKAFASWQTEESSVAESVTAATSYAATASTQASFSATV